MTIALFYDTETTGLPLFKEPSEDPRQPHIVQLAALLVDLNTRKTLACMNMICRPDGWEIPEEMAAIHGITNEQALLEGLPESYVLSTFRELHEIADERIAHNESFDARIIRIAIKRILCDDELADAWKAGNADCTARLTTPICSIPPTSKMTKAGFLKFKTPNLQEAYQHFFGKPFEGAHDAMADVLACKDVYFAIIDRQQGEAA